MLTREASPPGSIKSCLCPEAGAIGAGRLQIFGQFSFRNTQPEKLGGLDKRWSFGGIAFNLINTLL